MAAESPPPPGLLVGIGAGIERHLLAHTSIQGLIAGGGGRWRAKRQTDILIPRRGSRPAALFQPQILASLGVGWDSKGCLAIQCGDRHLGAQRRFPGCSQQVDVEIPSQQAEPMMGGRARP